ncbi:MAG: periplasmic heavy metal sensor [Candidatus Krumholzibacteriia bacterium]
MKRVWMLVLLVSLGLTLGLGLGLLRRGTPPAPAPGVGAGGPEADLEAGPPPELADRFMRRRIEQMTHDLDLDAAQQAALTEIYQRNGREVFLRRDRLHEGRRRIHDLIAAPGTTWPEVEAVLEGQRRLQSQLDSLVVRVMFEERQLLTQDQLERYREFTGPLGGRRGDEPGDRGRRGRGRDRDHEREHRPPPGR